MGILIAAIVIVSLISVVAENPEGCLVFIVGIAVVIGIGALLKSCS